MDFKTYKRMGLKWTIKHFKWCIMRNIRIWTSPKLWAGRLYALCHWRPGSKITFKEYEDLYPYHTMGKNLAKETEELSKKIEKEKCHEY